VIAVLGGEYNVDARRVLLEKGCKQDNILGWRAEFGDRKF